MMFRHLTLWTSLVVGGAIVAAAGDAAAKPDLIINWEDSRIEAGGCEDSDFLARGIIAVKNVGDIVAEPDGPRLSGALGMNWVVVYNPYNLDLQTDLIQLPGGEEMGPLDQEGFAFTLGVGAKKRFRNYGPPTFRGEPLRENLLSERDENRKIQAALNFLEFDAGGIDGDLGAESRNAIRQFQTSEGFEATGELTLSQRTLLYDKVYISRGADTEVQLSLFVAVDPKNLIDESNEANNIEAWPITIDCTPAGGRRDSAVIITPTTPTNAPAQ